MENFKKAFHLGKTKYLIVQVVDAEFVQAHTKKDGTKVKAFYRSLKNGKASNYSEPDNINPFGLA